MLKKSLPVIAVGLLAGLLSPSTDVAAQAAQVVNELRAINARLDEQVVPFTVVDATGGLCDSAGPGTSTVEITVDSDGTAGHFVITSVLLLTTAPGIPETGFLGFHINHVDIDGERFFTRTGTLLGPTDGFGVFESVDLMGTPVRRNSDKDAPIAGGNFPHQIVAESDGINDVSISMFCSTMDDDVSFSHIKVSGWKRPADTITVTFTPGS